VERIPFLIGLRGSWINLMNIRTDQQVGVATIGIGSVIGTG
jgi:hypothetical protein